MALQMIPHFLVDICGANSSSNCFLKILKYIHQKKRGVIFWEKIAFAFFDSVLKLSQLAPNHRSEKSDRHPEIALDWPFRFQKTMTSYSLGFSQRPKRCPLFDTCFLRTVLYMPGLLQLQASVFQQSLSQTLWDESIIGFLLLLESYFVESDFLEFALRKQYVFSICFFKLHVFPQSSSPSHPILS